MPEVTSPDSIPSLGTATAASSDTEEGVKDDVNRVLFPAVHQRKWEDFMARMRAGPPRVSVERESLFDSDQSILGSEQSVAFLDLAVDANSIVDVQEVGKSHALKGNLVRTNSDSQLSDVDARTVKTGSPQKTTPADPFSRFTGPLSASQLANIFSLCDVGEGVIWSKSPPIDENASPVIQIKKNVTIEEPAKQSYSGIAWMPRAQSLARECATLKEIIRVDSANILQLRQGLDHLKNINKEQVSQIEMLRTHLLDTRNKLDFLEREKEMLQVRDTESQGTIVLLKEEINQIAQMKTAWDQEDQERDLIMTDLEQLKFENELFASQVVENEKQLRTMKIALQEAETETAQLREEIGSLRCLLDEAMEFKTNAQVEEADVSAEHLLKQVAILNERFDQGEKERKFMALAFDEKLREKEVEIENIRGLIELEHEPNRVVPVTSLSGNTELHLASTRKQTTKMEQTDKTEPEQKSDCNPWRLLSDCLPG